MARSRTNIRKKSKKLRKKYKRGGAGGRYTGIDRGGTPQLALAAEAVKQAAAQEEFFAGRHSAAELQRMEEVARAKALALMREDDPDYPPKAAELRSPANSQQLNPSFHHSPAGPTRPLPPLRFGVSNVTRYDKEEDLCEMRKEKGPCDQQQGCNWNGDMNKCLPSSKEIDTGMPTRGSPTFEFQNDEERQKRLDEQSPVSLLLNQLLLASFGVGVDGVTPIDKLFLGMGDEVFEFIEKSDNATSDNATRLIQKIEEKKPEIKLLVKEGKIYRFPNTDGLGVKASVIKTKTDTLKATLRRAM